MHLKAEVHQKRLIFSFDFVTENNRTATNASDATKLQLQQITRFLRELKIVINQEGIEHVYTIASKVT